MFEVAPQNWYVCQNVPEKQTMEFKDCTTIKQQLVSLILKKQGRRSVIFQLTLLSKGNPAMKIAWKMCLGFDIKLSS